MAQPGFFNKTQNETTGGSTFIRVGGEQFHAVAVALIDCCFALTDGFKHSLRANEITLKKILERFFSYYPKFASNQPYLTVSDRMGILLNNSRKSEIVDCLAYVLRQLTIDEIYASCKDYPEVFAPLNAQTPQSYLRRPNTHLPRSALNALAQTLGLTISVLLTEPGKELPKHETYQSTTFPSSRFNLVLQVQGEQYFPAVQNEKYFSYVGQLAITATKPAELDSPNDTVARMMDQIDEVNKERLATFEQHRRTLGTMIDAGELTHKQLMDLFIKFLPKNNNSLFGHCQFYYDLEKLPAKLISNGEKPTSEKQQTQQLADTLAAWLTAKLVNADSLFEYLETKSAPGRISHP